MGVMRRLQAFRFGYNRALGIGIARHESGDKRLGYAGTANLLPSWKREPETLCLPGDSLPGSPAGPLRTWIGPMSISSKKRAGFPKLSMAICQNHAVVVIEDLNVKGMSASASGTAETPGRNLRQKSGLNRSILDQEWGAFIRMLDDKSAWNGGMTLRWVPKTPAGLFFLRPHLPRQPEDPGRIPLRLLRVRGQRRFQCGNQYPKDPKGGKRLVSLWNKYFA